MQCNRTSIGIVACSCVAMALSAGSANGVSINKTLTEENSSYGTNGGAVSQVSITPAGPLGNFTVDFSSLGETVVSVTWSAPAGQLIEIDIPTGWSDIENIGRGVDGGLAIGDTLALTADDVTFEDLSGDALPTIVAGAALGNTEQVFAFLIQFTDAVQGDTYRFSSATIEVTVPASYDIAIDAPIEIYHVSGNMQSGDNPAPPDPGQWIRLVPEPTTAMLLGLGLFAVVRRGPRRVAQT